MPGGWRDEPKDEQKIVARSRVLCNNYLEGLFHTVPSSFVLHCSINVMERIMEITTSTCRMMLMTGKTMDIWMTGNEMMGMACMAGMSRISYDDYDNRNDWDYWVDWNHWDD